MKHCMQKVSWHITDRYVWVEYLKSWKIQQSSMAQVLLVLQYIILRYGIRSCYGKILGKYILYKQLLT